MRRFLGPLALVSVGLGKAGILSLVVLCMLVGRGAATTPSARPHPAAFLGASNRVVALEAMDRAALYSAKDGELIRKFSAAGRIARLEVTADEQLLCLATFDNRIGVWEIATGKKLWETATAELGHIVDASFSWNGKRLATCDDRNQSIVFDAVSGASIAVFQHGHRFCVNAALSPDGTKGTFFFSEGSLFTFDVAAQTSADTLLKVESGLRYSSDGKYAVGVTAPKHKWQVFTMDENVTVKEIVEIVGVAIRLKPIAGGTFLATTAKGTGAIFDPESGEVKEVCNLPEVPNVMHFDIDPTSLLGVSTDYKFVTRVVNFKTGELRLTIDNSANYRRPFDLMTYFFYDGGCLHVAVAGFVLVVLVSALLATWRRWRAKKPLADRPNRQQPA